MTQTEFNSLAKTGGAKTHTLTVNEIAAHDHDFAGQTISWGATGNVHFDNVQAIAGAPAGNRIYTWQDTHGWADTYNRGGGQAAQQPSALLGPQLHHQDLEATITYPLASRPSR